MAAVFDLPIVGPMIKNGVTSAVSGAVTAAGGYAGDLVIGAGNLVEQGGRTVGNGKPCPFIHFPSSHCA